MLMFVPDASAQTGRFNWSGAYAGVHGAANAGLRNTQQNFNTSTVSGFPPVGMAPGVTTDGEGINWQSFGTPAGTQGLSSLLYSLIYGFARIEGAGADVFASQASFANAPTSFSDSRKIGGGIGGEIGYNVQSGGLVYGLAADITRLRKSPTNNWASNGSGGVFATDTEGPNSLDFNGTQSANGNASIGVNWLGIARVNVGLASDRALWYVTGGLAFGQAYAKASASLAERMTLDGEGSGPFGAGLTTNSTWAGSSTAIRPALLLEQASIMP